MLNKPFRKIIKKNRMPDDQSTMYQDGGIEEREKGSIYVSIPIKNESY